MKVSAIVSTYNSEKFIRGCIEDLICQTLYKKNELEIIIVNSGSEENEDEIILEYKAKYNNIKYIKTAERENVYQAWNRGVKEASGEYITNANTDDRHKEDALEIMATTLDDNNDIDLVYADIFTTTLPNQSFDNLSGVKEVKRPDYSLEIMSEGCFMGPQPMWRKNIHTFAGYFNEAYCSAGDYEFWCRLAYIYKKKFMHISQFLGVYYLNNEGIELSNNRLNVNETNIIKYVYKKIVQKEKISKNNIDPIDIVFLTYNRSTYFKRTIEYLYKNTKYPFNIIIVDNNSDSELKTYLELTQLLYSKIIFNENNEWTKAFQKGIEVTKSDPFIVSDPDILVPEFHEECWLEKILNLHKENSQVGMLALNLDPTNKPDKLPDVYIGKKEILNNEITLCNVGTVMQSIKRKYFNFSYETDWETCERIRQNGGMVGFAKNIVAYHLGWNEEEDYPDYIVDKFQYFKQNYGVDTYKMYTGNKDILNKMDEVPQYYSFRRPEIQQLVNMDSKIILDVGCGTGALGKDLKAKMPNVKVWGIELNPEMAKLAESNIDKVLIGDAVENINNLPDNFFDTIIIADVVEHLDDTESFITSLIQKLKPTGEIVGSIPNVQHWSVVFNLLRGNWEYEDAGILDRTHLRFFTDNSLRNLLMKLGLKIAHWGRSEISFPDEKVKSAWEILAGKIMESGFVAEDFIEKTNTYQFIFKCKLSSSDIIMPVFNQLDYTIQSIESLSDNETGFIVINNASDEPTTDFLNSIKSPNFEVINNQSNLGFPAAINQGLTKSKAEYLIIANNDIIVPPNTIARMINIAEKDEKIGMVGCVCNNISGVQKLKNINYATIDEIKSFSEKLWIEKLDKYFEFPRIAFVFTLIKRKVVETIGGLDERFSPGNYEDDDYCLRAQIAGFKTVIAEGVFVYHKGSASFKADGEKKYNDRLNINRKIFVEKWGNDPDTIWLKGGEVKRKDPKIPLKSNLVEQYMERAAILLGEEDYVQGLADIEKAIEFYEQFSEETNLELSRIEELRDKIKKYIN